jgi:hypothetical protein
MGQIFVEWKTHRFWLGLPRRSKKQSHSLNKVTIVGNVNLTNLQQLRSFTNYTPIVPIIFFELLLLALPITAVSAPHPFDKALAFALTGSDGTIVVPISREKCIFRVGDETYYLNKVHVDRISYRRVQEKTRFYDRIYYEIELHGDDVVYEKSSHTKRSGNPLLKEIEEEFLKRDPNFFSPKLIRQHDHKLHISTTEEERLVRAWRYIYANGCKGAKSLF